MKLSIKNVKISMGVALALLGGAVSNSAFSESITGQIGVSLTILPSSNSNECSNGTCSINTETTLKEMKNETILHTKNFIATKEDGTLTVSY